jgi:hypothetical protein
MPTTNGYSKIARGQMNGTTPSAMITIDNMISQRLMKFSMNAQYG